MRLITYMLVIISQLPVVYVQYDDSLPDIRLIGGNNEREGRVEIRRNGVWGTVCGDSWFDIQDADVLCRMLHRNLSALEYHMDGRYGSGIGPIFYRQLTCSGSEQTIHDCSSETGETCSHSSDVGLKCSGCPPTNLQHYGRLEDVNITSNGDFYTGTCSNGTSMYQFQYKCSLNGTWEEYGAKCGPLDVRDVRFVDGVDLYEGNVEVLVGDTWGPVCAYTHMEHYSYSSVFCTMKGLSFRYEFHRKWRYWYTWIYSGVNSVNGFIGNLQCPPNADHLSSCIYKNVYVCDNQLRMSCEGYPLNISSIQLVDGSSPYHGIVELRVDDTVGTICEDYFDFDDARVLCAMIGLNASAFYVEYHYNASGRKPMIRGLECSGKENHINNCSYSTSFYLNPCPYRAVALVCTECGYLHFSNGQIESYNETTRTLSVRCHSDNSTYVAYICEHNGTWSRYGECLPAEIEDLRLVNTDYSSALHVYGTIEIKIKNTWGTICARGFESWDATVLCKMLNASYAGHAYYGQGSGAIHMSALKCSGSENNISQCSYQTSHQCTHADDVGISCQYCHPISISGYGFVKYHGNGTMATMFCNSGYYADITEFHCIDGQWSPSVADCQRICPDLAVSGGYIAFNSDQNVGTLICNHGMYSNVTTFHCENRTWSPPDAVCLPNCPLLDSSNGYVAYLENGMVGTLLCNIGYYADITEFNCIDGNWSPSFAACQPNCPELSVSGGSLSFNSDQTAATLNCNHALYSNVTTFHCENRTWSPQNAVCLPYPPLNITDVRLVGGPDPNVGRVEIAVDGVYGTVCDSSFDYIDADVICKTLNTSYRASVYFTDAIYGEGSGPVHIDQLLCDHPDTSLDQCMYVTNNQCGHNRDVSLLCNECGQPEIAFWGVGYFNYNGTFLFANCEYFKTYVGYLRMTCTENGWETIGECQEYSRPLGIQEIRLVNGSKPSNGRVEIKVFDTWGTICSDNFGTEEANVICKMIGYPPSKAFHISLFEGSGPIFIDNIECGTNSSHINECQYVTYDDCDHSKDVFVSCTDCGDPKPINGSVNDTSSSVGSVVSVTCDHGRILVGDSIIVCQENGYWTSTPSCHLIDCGDPSPVNGFANGTSYIMDDAVSVSCDTGYFLSGDSVIRCQNNSYWTDYPTCKIADCEQLTIANMIVDIGNTTIYGQIAVVRCKPDFTPRGSWAVKCEATGVWNYTHVPECELIDCGASAPPHGIVNDTESTVGTVVSVSCEYGRKLVGDSVLVCAETGKWSGSSLCPLIECDDPTPENGMTNGTTHLIDSVLSVSCMKGFTLSGNSVIRCLPDSTWSDYPNCTIVDCSVPDAVNMTIDIDNATTYGQIAVVSCKPEFSPRGSWSVKCEASGTWNYTLVPRCELIECGDPTPSKGLVNSSETTVKAVVNVSCEHGYTLSGDSVIVCEETGIWSGNPICDPSDCGRPAISNAQVFTSSSTSLNSSAAIVCNEGFTREGPSVINCTETGWSDNVTCLPIVCDKMEVENGRVIGTSTKYGDVIDVECLAGYRIQGDSKLTCKGKGQWSDHPTCAIQNCGNVTVPTNGMIMTSSGETTFNSSLRFQCDIGYQLVGNDVIWCEATGKWNNSVPICIRKYCGDPTPENGVVNGTSYHFNDVVSVSCNNGYTLSGRSVIQCQSNSNWTDYPICNIVACERIVITNGKVTGRSTEFESIIELECDIGYDLHGDRRVVCQANGQWSGKPTCIIKDCGNVTLPFNGSIVTSPMLTTFNAKLRFKCNDGFLLTGNDVMWCAETGAWNSSVPTCKQQSDIGGPCTDAKLCRTHNAICENKTCKCISGVVDRRTEKCDIMPLLPFGKDEGDIIMDQDDCSEPIIFSPGIPVFKRMRRSMHVCRCGLISFDKKYRNNKPVPADSGKLDIIEPTLEITDPVVAAYFADIHVDKTSSVSYRTYDILNNYPYTARATEDIRVLESLIKRVENISSFDAGFVLIATWNSVKPKALAFNRNNQATFQLAIVSNGERTYSVTIYGHELMNWAQSSTEETISLWIGHAGENGATFNHLFSFKPPALWMDTGTKSGGISGLLLKNIDENDSAFSHNAVDCINGYNKNRNRKQTLQVYSQRLPTCPCAVHLARWDPWFWQIRWRMHDSNDIICVDMIPGETYKPFGKSCCYYRTSLTFVDMQPLSGGFLISHPSFSPRDHEINDVIMKEKCCTTSEYCDLYYQLHPIGTCYTVSPYNFGSFWGDPHMRTLDGMNYTFNGVGEYVLLNIDTHNITFSLQARTERAVKADGNLSDATIFTAFAARDNTNSSVHVELNRAHNNVTLYGNGIDLTKTLREVGNDTFVFSTSTLTIHEEDDTLRVSFLDTGITLEIGKRAGMLSMDTIVPKTLNNVTKGLLGNFDGDPHNDFVYPNGSLLHFNASEMEIFYYGQTWSVNDSVSVFIYEDGKKHSDYHNASYVPRFLDTVDNATLAAAIKTCNGSEHMECIFDFAFTLNIDIAKTTNSKLETIDIGKKEIAQVMPTINNTCSVNATIGERISCKLNLEDALEIKFVNHENTGTTYNRTSHTLNFEQKDDLPHNIWFVAVNADGKQSQQHTVTIQLCTGCHGNGHCSTTVRPDPRENAHFKYSSCVCNPGYTGDDCDKEYDWCAERPCSLGRNCTNVPQNGTYSCSLCPNGYAGVPGTNDCIDINECDKTSPCDHICINTEGSYTCDCDEGFRVDTNNGHRCIDINECNEATHNCTQICDNTIGGFLCKCLSGYAFDVSDWTCLQDDSDPCAASTIDCSQTSGCTLSRENKTTCFCDAGFMLNETSLKCQDVDECSQNICAQDCTNTIGSFQCSCIAGYQLEDRVSCKPCVLPYWGVNCEHTCDCSGRGAERCDPVRGCMCSQGWTGRSCDDDVDECKNHMGVCNDARKSCINNMGSFRCDCLPGYNEDVDGKCQDIEECTDPQLNECSQTCLNAEGSYTCGCGPGYTEVNSTYCSDIDECNLQVAACDQMCENHPGYYNCYCHFGYRLNDDRSTCSKVKDFCKELRNLTCAGYCVLEDKVPSCKCHQGFQLASDQQSCTDINECEEDNKCSERAICTNTEGSFVCECPVGMKLQNTKRTCTECDKYHYGRDCSLTCSCINGVCNSTVGCVCNTGWTGVSCDVDLDECSDNNFVCYEPNTQCLNMPGSAACVCLEGLQKNMSSGMCDDVNECSTADMNTCDQICTNTNGGYVCSCRAGFVLRNGNCNDINECLGDNECQQQCANTIGSYRCFCRSGFTLDLTDRKSCLVEKECTSNQSALCSGVAKCSVSNSEVMCVCPNGYNGTNCSDIDECVIGKNTCSQDCNNTDGGYRCQCKEGYVLQNDNATCTECINWTYGKNCLSKCECNVTNTNTCNSTNGKCMCLKGWQGKRCSDDVDECTSTQNVCPTYSNCINLSGGFTCECYHGYLKNSSGQCQACPQGRFGKGCTSKCLCDMSHTSDCNIANGSCKCDAGWMGPTCNADVDECLSINGFKCHANSTCVNTRGSYKCHCDPGFKTGRKGDSCIECTDNTYGNECSAPCECVKDHTLSNTKSCETVLGTCLCTGNWVGKACEIDVDECKTDACKDKNSICVNLNGSFACYCKRGFVEDDVSKYCTKVTKEKNYEQLDLQITLNISIDQDLDLTSDETFAAVATKVTLSLRTYLLRFVTHFKIVVTDLRKKGSLVANYSLFYANNVDSSTQVLNALVGLMEGTFTNFDGRSVQAMSEQSASLAVLCGLYEKGKGPCEYGTVCDVIDNAPMCVLDVFPKDNYTLIVGFSVAGGLLFAIAIIMAICIVVKRKARNANKQIDRQENRSDRQRETMFWRSPFKKDSIGSESGAQRYRTWRSIALGFSQKSAKIPRLVANALHDTTKSEEK